MKTIRPILALAALSLMAAADPGSTAVDKAQRPGDPVAIRSEMAGNRQTYVLENSLYRVILVPELAQFPLSLVNKATGHDYFAQPESEAAANDLFRFFGIVDSLPWVSGKSADGVKFPNKGLLYSVPWQCATGTNRETAWFEGTAEIAYQEPVGNATQHLRYTKRVTGRTGSPDILMEHVIRNTGKTPARFTMTLHARTAVAGYDKGDYLYVPGSKASISYMKYPALEQRGLVPGKEIAWPFPEATEFAPGTNALNVFVFLPADWAVAGDDKTGEALLIKGGKVTAPGAERTVKMALFMTNTGYLIEPGLTSCIEATPESWTNPANTVRLEPGQTCEFSITLTPLSNVHRADWTDAGRK